MMNSNKPAYKLTDKDFRQINRRSLFGFQLGWNYERMQASGYLYTILPQLRKIYGDGTPELKKMMKTHTQFFNTSNFFNTIITGIDLAVEEKEGIGGEETVVGMKTGLMGSFASIGKREPSRHLHLDCSPSCRYGLPVETTSDCL